MAKHNENNMLPDSFGIKWCEDERWSKYIDWLNSHEPRYGFEGNMEDYFYGIDIRYSNPSFLSGGNQFSQIITLDEWEKLLNTPRTIESDIANNINENDDNNQLEYMESYSNEEVSIDEGISYNELPPKSMFYTEVVETKPTSFMASPDEPNIYFDMRVFETGSIRDNDINKPLVDHLDPYVRLRFGYLLREGARKYGAGNWKKGQSTSVALESLHRHLAKYEYNINNGLDQDEDHLMAIIFNVQLMSKNEEKEGIKPDHFFNYL